MAFDQYNPYSIQQDAGMSNLDSIGDKAAEAISEVSNLAIPILIGLTLTMIMN